MSAPFPGVAASLSAEGARQRAQSSRDEQVEASWRQRALNAEDALKAANAAAAENTALKQRARQLSDENRSLQDKLQACRSNNRFLDKRIADLEARILDVPPAATSVPHQGASE